jgi:hypothetical protein
MLTLFYNIDTIITYTVACSLYTFDLYIHVQRTHTIKDITIIDITVLFHLRIDCTRIVTALIDCHTTF